MDNFRRVFSIQELKESAIECTNVYNLRNKKITKIYIPLSLSGASGQSIKSATGQLFDARNRNIISIADGCSLSYCGYRIINGGTTKYTNFPINIYGVGAITGDSSVYRPSFVGKLHTTTNAVSITSAPTKHFFYVLTNRNGVVSSYNSNSSATGYDDYDREVSNNIFGDLYICIDFQKMSRYYNGTYLNCAYYMFTSIAQYDNGDPTAEYYRPLYYEVYPE